MRESEKWKWSLSVVSDSATPWTAAYQAPPSITKQTNECNQDRLTEVKMLSYKYWDDALIFSVEKKQITAIKN